MKTVYDFTVKDRQGNDVSLSEYQGKVLLIVNTATGCGFTPHYEPLEAMYREPLYIVFSISFIFTCKSS